VSKVPQNRAPNGETVSGINNVEEGREPEEKCSGHFAAHRFGLAAGDLTAQPFEVVAVTAAKSADKNVGVPFSDVSFRAFTASPNVEKGTPTGQPFDNRSIA